MEAVPAAGPSRVCGRVCVDSEQAKGSALLLLAPDSEFLLPDSPWSSQAEIMRTFPRYFSVGYVLSSANKRPDCK